MFRILDRYLVKEMVMPFLLGLTVLTFILELPPILAQGEDFISKGVEWNIVARVLMTLLPSALCITIPMAVLLGILVGLGRLSADREFVAMQACGVSLMRLARPVLLMATLGTAATAYETIVALPNANQAYREIVFVAMATRVEQTVRPRVFFDTFPNKMIYVRELPPGGGWKDVFLADTSRPAVTTVYFAREGRIRLDEANKLVQLELKDYTSHTTYADNPDGHDTHAAPSLTLTLDPNTVFKQPPTKGAREMTYAELAEEIKESAARNEPAYEARFMVQQKMSLPLACPVLALIGLALGATNRKDGKLASFAVGIAVIFVYYVLLWGARAAAIGGRMSPEWAPWTPNIVLGVAGLVMVWLRARAADQPIRISMPGFLRRRFAAVEESDAPKTTAPAQRPIVLVVRMPRLNLPRPKILDLYLSREYLRIFALGLFGLLGVFYISTFIDLVDKLLRGEATGLMILQYFYLRTPQFIFYIIPMGVLVSTLVTIGLMTKSGELLVMRACGISLYRSALPLLLFGFVASGVLFVMQERVLAPANREADALERVIRHYPPALNAMTRRWLFGRDGQIYHYDYFDTERNRFNNLLVYELDDDEWRLQRITRAAVAFEERVKGPNGLPRDRWRVQTGWVREIGPVSAGVEEPPVQYFPFDDRELSLERSSYFKAEEPIAEAMTYAQLSDYIARLQASGANVVPQMVALQRKVAFPFVTVIMTVLAVPFAVTTGRRGAMYGVGIGIMLAITYWVMLSVSGALGAGGVMTPVLAAWAPNIIFGAAALYLVLTVRT